MKIISVIILFLFSACSTSKVLHLDEIERITNDDSAFGAQVVKDFEPQIKTIDDPAVVKYLETLAISFVGQSSDPKKSPVRVHMIKDIDKKWQTLSLPMNQIYISKNILKKLEYENELVGLIAVELMHLTEKHVSKRVLEISKQNPGLSPHSFLAQLQMFGGEGVLNFSMEFNRAAFRTAVGALYRLGYDSRGLASLLNIYQKNIEFSPYNEETINQILLTVRQEVAIYPPLRNPIIRTKEFLTFQKRIRRL